MGKIQKLEWTDDGTTATGLGIVYAMCEREPGFFELYSPFHTDYAIPKIELQKLCQKHFEERVMEWILEESDEDEKDRRS